MWPQGVLLDFDGVIADTEPSNAAYLAAALRRFGVELTEAERLALVGVSDKTTLERLLSRAKTPVSPAALAEERRRCAATPTRTAPACGRSPGCVNGGIRCVRAAWPPRWSPPPGPS